MKTRWQVPVVAWALIVSFAPAARTHSQEQQKPDPMAILASAREALGGDRKLSAVRSINATGRTRKIQGNNLLPVEFEIWCELPDKYARRDEVPAQESGPTVIGFNGDGLIQVPAPQMPAAVAPPGRSGAMTPDPAVQFAAMKTARVTSAKQDLARLTLGLFAGSFSSYPLTFTYVGQAEAPQGKADVVEAKGAGDFTVRFFVNTQTHLPVMVSWNAPGRPQGMPPGGPIMAPPQAGAAQGTTQTMMAPPKPTEFRIYYADYRDADGLMWPYRLRRATNADTTEETTFDRFRTNVKIDPRKFEVVK